LAGVGLRPTVAEIVAQDPRILGLSMFDLADQVFEPLFRILMMILLMVSISLGLLSAIIKVIAARVVNGLFELSHFWS